MDMSINLPGANDAGEQAQSGGDYGMEVGATHGQQATPEASNFNAFGLKTEHEQAAPPAVTAGRMRFTHVSEHLAEFQKELELDRASPLVTVDAVDVAAGCIAVTFHDRSMPNFRYEFWCRGPGDALHWVAHLAEKGWVTTRHLEIFARHVADHFGVRENSAEILPVRTVDELRAARLVALERVSE